MMKDINYLKNGSKSQKLLPREIKTLSEQVWKLNNLNNKLDKINKFTMKGLSSFKAKEK